MTIPANAKVIKLPEVVGKGYGSFWRFRGRYRIVKGGRGSKKSTTTAMNYIQRMMEYPESNLMVVRKVYRTIKDSCYTQLLWAINRLGVSHLWDSKESPLEMTYKPTGQKIYFRGLDDPLKITSITVEVGYLCWLWIEEAYEISSESDFDMLDESIRGVVPDDLFKQVTLTFNPWNEKIWIKRRFFDVEPNPDIFTLTTNYMCNEWLDAADKAVFERMKIQNPRRYQVAGLGNWGIAEGLVFENWEEKAFDVEQIRNLPSIKSAFGLDFGYTNDPTAFTCLLIDLSIKTIWIFDEFYEHGFSHEKIAEKIISMGYAKEKITADSSEPKSIDRLRELGIRNIHGARKGKDSISNGIDFLQDFKIFIHPKCVNRITEISNYC